ncbi:hypothetical protein EDD36DRAFT_445465 [Exophiala viscosa]|uniref:Protein NO VEIN C-terminal domain-containing protein n=1 Tax=Exophiala viscosa TaxID=2486360 RepID=A0AAN6DPA4_9EURO|nr:hypothetical protein EDD36DRAFT_445465 [Exophiala viscosa]
MSNQLLPVYISLSQHLLVLRYITLRIHQPQAIQQNIRDWPTPVRPRSGAGDNGFSTSTSGKTALDMGGLLSSLPGNSSLPAVSEPDTESLFGPRGISRDFMIGAAGELYIFERLKDLALDAFSANNWRSRIRNEVKVHPDYADSLQFNGPETADIVYTDVAGQLSRFLQANCYEGFPAVTIPSQSDRFFGQQVTPITYYLEVKTTTSYNADERLYMSAPEYKLTKDCASQEGSRPTHLSVLLRVYDITSDHAGVKLFVDPCRFVGNDGVLRFEVGQYHVYPKTVGA